MERGPPTLERVLLLCDTGFSVRSSQGWARDDLLSRTLRVSAILCRDRTSRSRLELASARLIGHCSLHCLGPKASGPPVRSQ
eukprot:3300810-Prymnesium_polylepis.1